MQKIHFVGIKGSGISALAQVYARMGCEVTGSDTDAVFFTDELLRQAGITQISGPSAHNVQDADIVCHSPAYGDDHIEIKTARELGIEVLTYPQMLGRLMESRMESTVTVSGTHGKTTTTSMIANMLLFAELDPLAIIGSKNYNIGTNGRYGTGHLVAEACEYRRNFHNYSPKIAIINNIDFDHPDYFSGIDDVFDAFQTFVDKVPEDGHLITWGDQALCRQLVSTGKILYFGLNHTNDIYATDVTEQRGMISFMAWERGQQLGTIEVRAIGEHNVLNVLAAITLSRILQVPFEAVQKSFTNFGGVYRRFDYLGRLGDVEVYDDYAHHPSEIEATLKAVKRSFARDHLLTVFQPHTVSRTLAFLDEFADALTLSDEVMLVKIYQSAREVGDRAEELTNLLAERIAARGKTVHLVNTLEEGTEWILQQRAGKAGLVLTMGAGDIRGIGERLIAVHV
ncbi:UDP-N-acetylmuramate--L-alanine ligase [Tumebacillus algifaecis]|uniref:UDP-N-acetylmuramate--L-alanine ligase n=1 Tax=Tumebacillus algifaecis TaxID=1214604 RepID=UPI0012FE31D8|nr:UDP-N-acetylmuramate--L-alanine ligase [Tumebacillus algifaecis]